MRLTRYINEQISAGEGENLELAIGDSTVDYELVRKSKIIYVHDLFVFSSARKKGFGTKLIKALVKKYKGYTFWLASTNPTMNRVSEKAGFEKICDNNFKNCKIPEGNLPKGVRLSNATVYRLTT